MTKLLDICPDFPDWPRRWMFGEPDLKYGQDLLKVMRPFADHLVQSGLTDKTLKKRLTNLWLLGGEIIRDIDIYQDHSVPALEKLKRSVGPDGGLSCRYLDSEAQQRSYDSTCRMLHRYLERKPEVTKPCPWSLSCHELTEENIFRLSSCGEPPDGKIDHHAS